MAGLGNIYAGIGAGLSSFTDSAQKQQQLSQQKQQGLLQQQQMASGLLSKGQQVNPDSGQVELNAMGQATQNNQLEEAKREAELRDPMSERSKSIQQNVGRMLDAAHPTKQGEVPMSEALGLSKASGNDIYNHPYLKQFMEGGIDLQKERLKATTASGGRAAQNDRNIRMSGKEYDTSMMQPRKLLEDVSRLEGALNTKDENGNQLITAQQLGDANAVIARIFSPGHMSDATVSRTEYESMPAKFAAAVQALSTNPKDIKSRKLVDHILDQAHHIANVSNDSALTQLDTMDTGLEDIQEPGVKSALQRRSKSYRDRFSKKYQTVGEASQGSGMAGPVKNPDGSWSAASAMKQSVGQQYTPDVVNYAKTHNISPDAAQQIKLQRGGK